MTARLHHVRIRKARGVGAFMLRLTGRGLWTVQCVGCPWMEFPTYREHGHAITVACAHLRSVGVGVPAAVSTDDILTPETAERIRAAVMAHAAERLPQAVEPVPFPWDDPTPLAVRMARALRDCQNPTSRRAADAPPTEREADSGDGQNPTKP